jgi:hypothetical protein
MTVCRLTKKGRASFKAYEAALRGALFEPANGAQASAPEFLANASNSESIRRWRSAQACWRNPVAWIGPAVVKSR